MNQLMSMVASPEFVMLANGSSIQKSVTSAVGVVMGILGVIIVGYAVMNIVAIMKSAIDNVRQSNWPDFGKDMGKAVVILIIGLVGVVAFMGGAQMVMDAFGINQSSNNVGTMNQILNK